MQEQKITLSEQASQIHSKLAAKILTEIDSHDGWISFEKYMQMALYTPQLGYYQNEISKIGEDGDFITAPELGSLFAKSLGSCLKGSVELKESAILELGAGTGALAVSLLAYLAENDCLPKQYFILEPSASLQAAQKASFEQAIPALAHRIVWLKQLPEKFEGIIIGNEVVDAIPSNRIVRRGNQWLNQGVGYSSESNEFCWVDGAPVAVEHLPNFLQEHEQDQKQQPRGFADGYATELRPLVKGWVKSLVNCLARGKILLFDYGYPQAEYYHFQRREGTLRCFSRHLAHSNPLALAGLQDITAHVDFTQLAIEASKAGATIEGFSTQAGYLLENGILEIEKAKSDAEQYRLSQEIQKLTAPGQMGEVMKVICLSVNSDKELSGFTLQDQLCRL